MTGAQQPKPEHDCQWEEATIHDETGDLETVRVCVVEGCGRIHPDDSSDGIHTWFSLTYANYMVLPRSHLQSMPMRWQRAFVKLLKEWERMARANDWPSADEYRVMAVQSDGKFAKDPCPHYARGRTQLPRPRCRE